MIKTPEENFELHKFVSIPYRGSRYPGKVSVKRFREGSNCQLFALGVLDSIGFLIDHDMRSDELWNDTNFMYFVGNEPIYFEIFDVLFFMQGILNELDPKRFHLGIYLGKVPGLTYRHCVLHNPRPGPSTIWPLEDFEKSSRKHRLFGAKRPFRLKAPR